MGVLGWGDGFPTNFQHSIAMKVCIGPQKFSRCKNIVKVLYYLAKFGRTRTLPAAGVAKNVEFLYPPYWIGQAIIFLPCGSTLLFFFLTSSKHSQTGCLAYFYTWCGLSANLECRSEMWCTRLAGNTGRKNDAKNRHLRTIAQPSRAISSQLRHMSTIGQKLVKQQYLLHMSLQYGELRAH